MSRFLPFTCFIALFGCGDPPPFHDNNDAPDPTLSVLNSDPTLIAGPVQFLGTTGDTDQLGHQVQWLINGQIVESEQCEVTIPRSESEALCTIWVEPDAVTIDLIVTDSKGKVGQVSQTFGVRADTTPVAQITSTTEQLTGLLHLDLAVAGKVADAEDDDADLAVTWTIDGKGVALSKAEHNANGTLAVTALLAAPGSHKLLLEVEDSYGNVGSDTAIITVLDGAPVVEITDPTTFEFLDDDIIEFLADVNEPNPRDDEEIKVVWSVDGEGQSEMVAPASTQGAWFTPNDIPPGMHSVTLTVTDIDGFSGDDSIMVFVDGKPSAPEVSIAPTEPKTDDALMVFIDTESIDPDGDTPDYHYQWRRDGLLTNETGSSLVAAVTEKGDAWSVDVYATDAPGQRSPTFTSDAVTIGNTAPNFTGITISPTNPTSGDTLTCEAVAADADILDQLSAIEYTWYLDPQGIEVLAIGDTLAPQDTHPGDEIWCDAQVSDGTDSTSAATSTTIAIQSAPSLDSVVLAPNPARSDDTIMATPTGWQDWEGDAEAYVWTWENQDGLLAGAQTAELDRAHTTRGDEIRACATPVNTSVNPVAVGTEVCSGSFVVGDTLLIGNALPIISAATIEIPAPLFGSAQFGDTLTANYTGWYDEDGDTADVNYQWFVNGNAILGALTSQLAVEAPITRGDELVVQITPWDGLESDTPKTSAPIVVGNSPPTVVSIVFNPADVNTSTDIVATILTTDPDPDDAADVTTALQWSLNGADIPGATTQALGHAAFERGDVVVLTAVPSDPQGLQGQPFSQDVVIGNALPTCTAHLSPSAPTAAGPIAVVIDSWTDADDPQGAFINIDWTVTPNNGSPTLFSTPGTDLQPAFFSRGDRVIASATPSDDGAVHGVACVTEEVEVGNARPSIDSVVLSPAAPYTEADIIAVASGLTDADGDLPTVVWAWFADGVLLGGQNSSVLPASATRAAQVITASATPDDGQASNNLGSPALSNPILITNRIPTAPAVAVTPDPESRQDIVCTITTLSTDGDNDDAVSYVFEWTQDGESVESSIPTTSMYPGDTIPNVATAPGQVFTCTVYADDSHELSDPSDTALTTVSLPSLMAITAGDAHACALDTAGDVYCWGNDGNNRDRLRVPGEHTFNTISAGNNVTCGVTDEGTIACWGTIENVILDNIPSPSDASATAFLDVSTGIKFACAITDQPGDNLFCWGDNGTQNVLDGVPTGHFEWVEAGRNFACASDGNALACWGNNQGVDLVDNHPGGEFVSLSTRDTHACGIRSDLSVDCWGSETADKVEFAPTQGSYGDIAVGDGHSCALDEFGFITCWGQTGADRLVAPTTPHAVMAAGEAFTCAIDQDLTDVHCWGANSDDQAPDLWQHPDHVLP